MKCPKCGYNSFEFLDSCKKCGSEFASFKKSHRINPVLFRSGAAPAPEAPASSSTDRLAAVASAEPTLETFAPAADEEFSWEDPGATPAPEPVEAPYSGFNLDFVDLPPAESKDTEFGGFSFDEPASEPASPTPESPVEGFSFDEPDDKGVASFSFDEPADQEPASFSWETPDVEVDPEMDKYQRMLEPESMVEAAEDQKAGEKDYFGTMDFSFAPEQATEDIFQEGEAAAPKPAEKSAAPNLDNFDKEFELIFALDDKDDSGEK